MRAGTGPLVPQRTLELELGVIQNLRLQDPARFGHVTRAAERRGAE